MNVESVRSRPPGVVAVVLLTGLYGLERLLESVYSFTIVFPGGASWTAFWAGWAGLAVAYLLWRRSLAGWAAAVVLYAMWALDLGLGASVFGLRQVPLLAVVLVVLGYLLLRHDRFRSAPPATDSAAG